MVKKNYIIVTALLISCFSQDVYSQKYSGLQPKVDAYFAERLRSMDEETHLISFGQKSEIKLGKVEEGKSFVWERWKSKVLQTDSLPVWSTNLENRDSISIHHWELKKEDPMPFYFVRKSDDENRKHALFLNLHGSGPKNSEFKNTLAWTLRFEDKPSAYFIPQIPNEKRYRWWYKPVQYAWERMFRLAMLSDQIDAHKMYVMGISEGGYGSQRLAAFYADYLAGAGPMAGGEPLKNAPPLNFRNIAFSLETGEHDRGFGRNRLTTIAKEEFQKLATENPGQFINKIQLQPNKGHGIDYTVTSPWLVNYTRNSHPKHISWVLFPMDGRYRKGFYNIILNKPLAIKEGDEYDRLVFDIQFHENTINVKVELMNNEMTETKKVEDLDFSIFLDNDYIDYSKKVKVFVNDKLMFDKKVKTDLSNMIESCAIFGDQDRIFPSKIDISI